VLERTVTTLSKKSELAQAIHYALSKRIALMRYRDDDRSEIDNKAAERELRAVTGSSDDKIAYNPLSTSHVDLGVLIAVPRAWQTPR
jgi:Transposase IS66 family